MIVPGEKWVPDDKAKTWRQNSVEHFRVMHLERLRLGPPYPAQVQHVAALLARPPLDAGCTLIIDETGVGRAVGDIFDVAGLKAKRVTITGGLETSQHGGAAWHVPKAALISGLDARLQTKELKIADTIADHPALRDELKNFHRHVGDAGRSTWGARTGTHDDLVLAVALTVWWATSGPRASSERVNIESRSDSDNRNRRTVLRPPAWCGTSRLAGGYRWGSSKER